ncbi:tartrate dehydrogenase [Sulfobacillus sp. DSM 109850]|uniref:D-malate dehydrogenase (decarboxylating) n=1 Tax=Sulfobacillus harzensis TaxID=2729629 RepID=A0A7Y0L1S2_9FIRM|nr:tartrate dehydrogenase [Sulfobacillus harzensis]NMP21719.1 tartrate dehydrogenase [Sulfobacillus harzensis]
MEKDGRRDSVNHHSLAVIPGDGIGHEVVSEALRVLQHVQQISGRFQLDVQHFDWSCQYYLRHGRMMPEDGLSTLSGFEAIFLGAVGFPTVPDHVSLWGLLLPIRRGFDQYVNLRPVKILQGIESPLRRYKAGDINFVVVRENTEGEYSNIGGALRPGTPDEVVIQNSVFTRKGTERVMRWAFELARTSRKRLTAATKSNGLNYSMPFWDEVFRQVGREYPDVDQSLYHVDALASYFVTRPESFDVVVASNLFGDILTDLGGAIQGGLGLAASANINPDRRFPSMFEPVHGSAPDIAGKNIANPVAQLWTAKLMLDHLGYPEEGQWILDAIEATLLAGIKTPDLGGTATTHSFTDAVLSRLPA